MIKRAVSILVAVALFLALAGRGAVQARNPRVVTLFTLYSDELSSAAHAVSELASTTAGLFLYPLFSPPSNEEAGDLWALLSATSPPAVPPGGVTDATHGPALSPAVGMAVEHRYECRGDGTNRSANAAHAERHPHE